MLVLMTGLAILMGIKWLETNIQRQKAEEQTAIAKTQTARAGLNPPSSPPSFLPRVAVLRPSLLFHAFSVLCLN